jgi:Mpv17 / PMP22 family
VTLQLPCTTGHGPAAICAALRGTQLCDAQVAGGARAGQQLLFCSFGPNFRLSLGTERNMHVLLRFVTVLTDLRWLGAQGKPGEAVPKLKQDWKDAIIANWKLWPFFQFVNFRFVPPEQRV